MAYFDRRTLMLGSLNAFVAIFLLAACGPPPQPRTVVPAGAPPPQKIERLLVWLPESEFMDAASITEAFKTKFAARGVAVEVGVSTRLELDRREAVRSIASRFRPTNLLEFTYKGSTTQAPNSAREVSLFMIGTLTDTKGSILRQFVFPIRGTDSKTLIGQRFVDQVLAKLQEDGYV
jgi:hypothetical protein